MKVFKWIGDWIKKKFYDNLKELKENSKKVLNNIENIFLALIIMIIGFYVIIDYNWFSLLLYILTAIWVFFFNTLVLVKKPLYFYFTLIILLVADAIKPLLMDSFNFLQNGKLLMFFIHIGVWIAIRIKFSQLRNEN